MLLIVCRSIGCAKGNDIAGNYFPSLLNVCDCYLMVTYSRAVRHFCYQNINRNSRIFSYLIQLILAQLAQGLLLLVLGPSVSRNNISTCEAPGFRPMRWHTNDQSGNFIFYTVDGQLLVKEKVMPSAGCSESCPACYSRTGLRSTALKFSLRLI